MNGEAQGWVQAGLIAAGTVFSGVAAIAATRNANTANREIKRQLQQAEEGQAILVSAWPEVGVSDGGALQRKIIVQNQSDSPVHMLQVAAFAEDELREIVHYTHGILLRAAPNLLQATEYLKINSLAAEYV